jgi:hypothetical protein
MKWRGDNGHSDAYHDVEVQVREEGVDLDALVRAAITRGVGGGGH